MFVCVVRTWLIYLKFCYQIMGRMVVSPLYVHDIPNMVGLTPLFCGKVPDFAYIIQPTKKECFSPKYHRFHALDFWLESPPWVDFPMPSRSQENEVPQSSAPAEVHTTTASSGSEDAAPGVTTPIVIKHGWEFHGDL